MAEIVASWDSLPDALKADILAKVREAIGDQAHGARDWMASRR